SDVVFDSGVSISWSNVNSPNNLARTGDWDSDVKSARNKARDDLAKRLGYSNGYSQMAGETLNKTLIDGHSIRTGLIDANAVLADVGTFTDSLKIGSGGRLYGDNWNIENSKITINNGVFK